MKAALRRTLTGAVLAVLLSAAPAQAAGPGREPEPIRGFFQRIIKIIKNIVPAPNNEVTIPKP